MEELKESKKAIVHTLSYDKKGLKLLHCLQFIKVAGFKQLEAKKEKIQLNWNALLSYCKEHEEEIRGAFGCERKTVFGELTQKETKKQLITYIRSKLQITLGVRFKEAYKGSTTHYISNCFEIS